MAITGMVLADGQLPSTKGTLYEVPAGKKAFVKFFNLFNTGGTAQTIKLYYKDATSRQMYELVLQTKEAADVIDKNSALVLDAGDFLEGEATSATTVDYVISGAEE